MSEMIPVEHGTLEMNGKTVHWNYYMYKNVKRGELRVFYEGHKLIEDDHGFGLEHALGELRKHINNIESNKKDAQKASDAKT